jgi:multiple sugar transport system permease protein
VVSVTARLPGSGRKPGARGARWLPAFYLAPSLALFAVFIAFPFLRAIWFSFNETSFLGGVIGFVGTENYKAIFTDPQFGRYVGNSLVWVIGVVSLQLLFGLAGAMLLNQNFRLRGVVRGPAMIPWATPSVLVALIWMWMLEPNHGVINRVLLGLGVNHAPIAWLGQSSTARVSSKSCLSR